MPEDAKEFVDAFTVEGLLEAFFQPGSVRERPALMPPLALRISKVDTETNTLWFESVPDASGK